MKLQLPQIFHKTQKEVQEAYLALVFEQSYVQGVSFFLHGQDTPRIKSIATEVADAPSWEERIVMADKIVSRFDEGGDVKISKVVFGLGSMFLTKDGEIEKSVRGYLKDLTKKLGLTPLGYVPATAGIAHYLKRTEGVPPSIILVSVTKEAFTISIYRVGRVSFETTVKRDDHIGECIESGLYKDSENEDVLPSRILLLGADSSDLEEVKTTLLRYQWTSRANFLHYPKVEVFPENDIAKAIADAGASELAKTIVVDATEEDSSQNAQEKTVQEPAQEEKIKEEIEKNMTIEELEKEDKKVLEFKGGEIQAQKIEKDEKEVEEEENVVVVEPESLGFHKSDTEDVEHEKPREEIHSQRKPLHPITLFFIRGMLIVKKIIRKVLRERLIFLPLGLILLGSIAYIVAANTLPRATVGLTFLTKEVNVKETITIDEKVTEVNAQNMTVPGKKLEKEVNGEKTVSTTGKKKIGEAAKGSVIISNKTTSQRTFKKGTILLSGSQRFTLSDDVTIASASEDFRGSTWGTGTVGAVAESIGTEGNIAANTKFTFKDYDIDIAIARNEQAFTGGTSKDVTVVSRADYDGLLKSLTVELVEKAKSELAQNVTTKETLVDATVKTTVKEKQFIEEIDQEAKELHGKLTVTVSATTFDENDVFRLLSTLAEKEIPSGYTQDVNRVTVSVSDVKVAKDGKISALADLSLIALPKIDIEDLKKRIAGKKITDVELELRQIPGVATIEFSFTRALRKDVLPKNQSHIEILTSAQ